MHSRKQLSGRKRQIGWRCAGAVLGLTLAATGLAGAANAQELTHRFINPSFGGNPFYSDHLLSIANIHRPAEPEEPAEEPPSGEELIASQLRERLASRVSGDILDRIQNAQPGESGTFQLGDQTISFTCTQTETRITFFNGRTGETTNLVVPVTGTGNSPFSTAAAASFPSAEQVLGSSGTLLSPSSNGGLLSLPPL